MTDLDAAAYLKKLRDYNQQGSMPTPASPHGRDPFFDCALDHAIRALEERSGASAVTYRKHPNGGYSAVPQFLGEGKD